MVAAVALTRSLRYVVLHHTGYGQPHFDLMLETDADGPLLTWRLTHWPTTDGTRFVALPPHRRIYLDYVGVISGQRGRVRRVAAGNYEWADASINERRVVIDGRSLLLP